MYGKGAIAVIAPMGYDENATEYYTYIIWKTYQNRSKTVNKMITLLKGC